MSENNAILSPVALWDGFDDALPLKEIKTGEVAYDNVSYNDVYFSGRETTEGRVRIFGVYAISAQTKSAKRGGILIIPDCSETVNIEIIKLYAALGYAVLMVDYRGEFEGTENYTKYPESVAFANYQKSGRNLNYADASAKETCWYEWTAVARYGVSYLKFRAEIDKVCVLGIKNGANIGWMLGGTDNRVDAFCALFGAGWRSYKGIFKYSEKEIDMDDERFRFLAGAEAHAYAQYVKCPVMFLTATNNPEFDCDRSVDTLIRLNSEVENYVNYAPKFRDVLDGSCKKDIELFLGKTLLDEKIVFPSEPKLSIAVEGRDVVVELDIPIADARRIKSAKVFFSEGEKNPSYRDWIEMTETKSRADNKRSFSAVMNGNSAFVNAFCQIVCKNGVTICSKIVSKKVPIIKVMYNKLIYSTGSSAVNGSFSVINVKKHSLCGLFFLDEGCITECECEGIVGISSKFGLVSYRVNDRFTDMSESSIVVFDVFCDEYAELKLSLILVDENGEASEYSNTVAIKGSERWQNIMITCSDFKSAAHMSIKDYSKVSAIKLEAVAKCVINNILLI